MKKISAEKLEAIQALSKNKNNVVSINSQGKLRVALKCEDETKTQQQYQEASKISNIMKKYGATGMLNMMQGDPVFDDVSQKMDFQTAQIKIAKAQQQFAQLPSELRDKFKNDPGQLISFLNKSENYEEAVKLGLAKKKAEIQDSPEVKAIKDLSESILTSKTDSTPAKG